MASGQNSPAVAELAGACNYNSEMLGHSQLHVSSAVGSAGTLGFSLTTDFAQNPTPRMRDYNEAAQESEQTSRPVKFFLMISGLAENKSL